MLSRKRKIGVLPAYLEFVRAANKSGRPKPDRTPSARCLVGPLCAEVPMRWKRGSWFVVSAATLIVTGCRSLDDDVTTENSAVLGDFLPGLSVTPGLLA